MGSVKSRKVSTQSLQSTTSVEDPVIPLFVNFDDAAASTAAAGPDVAADEAQDTQTELRDVADEPDYCHNMPWIKVSSFVSDFEYTPLNVFLVIFLFFYSASVSMACYAKRCTSYRKSVCPSDRLSDRLSVTVRYCVKTTQARIMGSSL